MPESKPRDVVVAPTSELLVTWQDGHASVYGAGLLRRSCPCAECHDQRERSHEQTGGLRMAKGPSHDEIALTATAPVGLYGLNLRWRDGHAGGIYTFSYLRSLCPCAACVEQLP